MGGTEKRRKGWKTEESKGRNSALLWVEMLGSPLLCVTMFVLRY